MNSEVGKLEWRVVGFSLLTIFLIVTEHLYIHIPFCPKICPYCSFYKEASNRNLTQRFLDALLLELEQQINGSGSEGTQYKSLRPRTIFFGGGTPTALSTTQLEYLLTGLRERLDLSALEEWTIEMNPATVSLEKASRLRSLGVNRVSMGVQSWDPHLLKVLGRVHSKEQATRSYHILREAGFTNINLDLIFGIPGQTQQQWETSLEETIALNPDHISAYNLTYEEDTEYFRRFQSGELTQDIEADADLFELTLNKLTAAGYEGYEISNFAKPGKECLHNLGYWFSADYLGLGPSAFSTIGTKRWSNIRNTALYIEQITSGISAASFTEEVSEATRLSEMIAFSLRTNRGIARSKLSAWENQIKEHEQLGHLTMQPNGHIVLTPKGRLLADSVAESFV